MLPAFCFGAGVFDLDETAFFPCVGGSLAIGDNLFCRIECVRYCNEFGGIAVAMSIVRSMSAFCYFVATNVLNVLAI